VLAVVVGGSAPFAQQSDSLPPLVIVRPDGTQYDYPVSLNSGPGSDDAELKKLRHPRVPLYFFRDAPLHADYEPSERISPDTDDEIDENIDRAIFRFDPTWQSPQFVIRVRFFDI
jgi:hypothetical protein